MRFPSERIAIAVAVGLTIGFMSWPAASTVLHAWTPVALAVISGVAGWWTFRRLPLSIDGVIRRRPILTIAWGILALVMVVQTARLSLFVEDPSRSWWHTTSNEFWSKHSCMNAYFYAAELSRQGETNVYDADHYAVLNPEAENLSSLENLGPEDPYQYPPQFLLLPRAILAFSSDYRAIQAVWFSLQALLFALAMFLLARWYGGVAGERALWLMPLVWISVPSFLNFQYGQFHVTTIVLAMTAFLAFETKRRGLGGMLLGMAILAKGFPAILLIPMLLTRRWRALAWTGGSMLALTALAWLVLGSAPFEAFFQYHLPRVQNGTAFAFDEVWPEWKEWLLAGNVSAFAFVRKLSELGIVAATLDIARAVHSLFVGCLLMAALFTSWKRQPRQRALLWMAFLNLAALTSPAAWGDYIIVGLLWMVSFLFLGSTRQKWVAGALAAYCALVPGVVPVGNFPNADLAMALSLIATLLLLTTNAWIIGLKLRLLPARYSGTRQAAALQD